MAHQFTKIAFTEGVKAMQEHHGSRELYAAFAQRSTGEDRLGAKEADFIAARDSFYMGTVSSTGWPYIQFRGGPIGFLKVLDDKTLGFVDFRGNLQYLSTGNLTENDRVFLFLMDYPNRRRLKIWGRAQLFEATENPELIAQLDRPDYAAEKERAILIRVEAFDWNCPQHIPQRYSVAEVEQMLEPLRQRIQELEARLT